MTTDEILALIDPVGQANILRHLRPFMMDTRVAIGDARKNARYKKDLERIDGAEAKAKAEAKAELHRRFLCKMAEDRVLLAELERQRLRKAAEDDLRKAAEELEREIKEAKRLEELAKRLEELAELERQRLRKAAEDNLRKTAVRVAKDARADEECIVCMDAQATHMLYPCHHARFCARCADTLKTSQEPRNRCPLCRCRLTDMGPRPPVSLRRA